MATLQPNFERFNYFLISKSAIVSNYKAIWVLHLKYAPVRQLNMKLGQPIVHKKLPEQKKPKWKRATASFWKAEPMFNCFFLKTPRVGRWWRRRMLGSPCPTDHLDSTYTFLNNPENRQKTSRMESLEPSTDKRPTEEGRKGSKAVRTTWTGGREPGQRGGPPAKQRP